MKYMKYLNSLEFYIVESKLYVSQLNKISFNNNSQKW